jgi:hypothetical protein
MASTEKKKNIKGDLIVSVERSDLYLCKTHISFFDCLNELKAVL